MGKQNSGVKITRRTRRQKHLTLEAIFPFFRSANRPHTDGVVSGFPARGRFSSSLKRFPKGTRTPDGVFGYEFEGKALGLLWQDTVCSFPTWDA